MNLFSTPFVRPGLCAVVMLWALSPARAAAPFGHYILAKRLAEDSRDGKVPGAPPELVEALKDPETVRYFCGGAVAPDLKDTWTHHDGRPQKIGADLMQSAREPSPAGEHTGHDGLRPAATGLCLWLVAPLRHGPRRASRRQRLQGDAFAYTSLLKQGLHGNMESDLDAYVHKFLTKPGEKYAPAFPVSGYVKEKLGLMPDEFDSGREALATKVAAELGLKNIEKMNLSEADFRAKWGQALQQAEQETRQFIAEGRLPGDWDLDCGHISSKDFRRLHDQVVALNNGKLPADWGRSYLAWWEEVKNLDEQARRDRLAQLLGAAAQVPLCFTDLRDTLDKVIEARGAADAARLAAKKALEQVTPATQTQAKLEAAAKLPGDLNNAAAIIKNATTVDPQPIFVQLQRLEQAADNAQRDACKAADAAAGTVPPSRTDVAVAQQQAIAAATIATAAEVLAKPVVDAGKAVRDQLQAQKDLAQQISDLKEAIAQLPAAITTA